MFVRRQKVSKWYYNGGASKALGVCTCCFIHDSDRSMYEFMDGVYYDDDGDDECWSRSIAGVSTSKKKKISIRRRSA